MKRKFTLSLLCFFICFIYNQNNHIQKSFFCINSEKIAQNIRIVQISDTHNKKFLFNNYFLLKKLRDLKPDIIVHTGDLASKDNDCENSFLLMNQLKDICPVYFVQGNHDVHDIDYDYLKGRLVDIGINVLENESVLLENNLQITGFVNDLSKSKEFLDNIDFNNDYFKLCLIHKPINFEKLKNSNFDFFLSGHTHGCQWRIPFIGGVISPDKGFFPGYDYGYKVYNDTPGIINRGLGGYFIPRLNNYPEITILDISTLDK